MCIGPCVVRAWPRPRSEPCYMTAACTLLRRNRRVCCVWVFVVSSSGCVLYRVTDSRPGCLCPYGPASCHLLPLKFGRNEFQSATRLEFSLKHRETDANLSLTLGRFPERSGRFPDRSCRFPDRSARRHVLCMRLCMCCAIVVRSTTKLA